MLSALFPVKLQPRFSQAISWFFRVRLVFQYAADDHRPRCAPRGNYSLRSLLNRLHGPKICSLPSIPFHSASLLIPMQPTIAIRTHTTLKLIIGFSVVFKFLNSSTASRHFFCFSWIAP
jgi:hypothetical protein